MDALDELNFKLRVGSALEHVKTILDHTRSLEHPADVHHAYDDKYLLAEFLTNITLASLHSILEVLGVSKKVWTQLREWAQKRSVTLRLSCEEKCKFLREATRQLKSDTKVVTKGFFGKSESYTTTITEYFWSFTAVWEVSAFVGVESDKRIVIQSRTGNVEIKTTTKDIPRPEVFIRTPYDVNITWLLQHLDDSGTPTFHINRRIDTCKTPRRNVDVESCLTFLRAIHSWGRELALMFANNIFTAQHDHGLSLVSINADSVFVPVIPVFEKASEPSTPNSSKLIPPVIMTAFLTEQARSLDAKIKDLEKTFPSDTKLITFVEARLCVLLLHVKRVSEAYSQSIDSIEKMLYNQLIAAIGRQLTATDFSNYLTFHNRKIFKDQYRPQPFCYSVRRPGYYPEGAVSIESGTGPISTFASYRFENRPMKFSINASTQISFLGDRYLHGYIAHQFNGGPSNQLSLCARARQFISYCWLEGFYLRICLIPNTPS